MKQDTVEKLNKVLNISGDLVRKEKGESPSVEVNTKDLTTEYEFSQEQYHTLLDKGNDALDELLAVAKESENPRAFEVVTQLISGLTNTTKELLQLQKTKKEIEKDTKDPSTVNNSLFIGSTAELQKLLNKNK
jgi:predicted house-cleaning noncanonical NTP pyrophosphatase (MazG superfamily)